MKHSRVAVLDSCVVLSFLFGEPDGAVDGEEKFERSKREIDQLQREGYLLALPAIVPAELTSSKNAEKTGWPVADVRYQEFMNFLTKSEGLVISEADTGLATRAAEIAAEAPLKAGDAFILAAALAQNADVLITWDEKLIKKGPRYELEIRKPEIRGQEPLFD